MASSVRAHGRSYYGRSWPGLRPGPGCARYNKNLSCGWDAARTRLCTSYSQHCVPLVAIYWPDFPTRSWQHIGRIFQHLLTPSVIDAIRGFPRATWLMFGIGKPEWLGYNLAKVAWWLTQMFGYNTSTWQTHRQPRRHSNSRLNALRRAAKSSHARNSIHKPLYARPKPVQLLSQESSMSDRQSVSVSRG